MWVTEKLQQHFIKYVFKQEQEEYTKQGINWKYLSFVDNQECLTLIEKVFTSLMSCMPIKIAHRNRWASSRSWMKRRDSRKLPMPLSSRYCTSLVTHLMSPLETVCKSWQEEWMFHQTKVHLQMTCVTWLTVCRTAQNNFILKHYAGAVSHNNTLYWRQYICRRSELQCAELLGEEQRHLAAGSHRSLHLQRWSTRKLHLHQQHLAKANDERNTEVRASLVELTAKAAAERQAPLPWQRNSSSSWMTWWMSLLTPLLTSYAYFSLIGIDVNRWDVYLRMPIKKQRIFSMNMFASSCAIWVCWKPFAFAKTATPTDSLSVSSTTGIPINLSVAEVRTGTSASKKRKKTTTSR